jgi:hypothetical protein
MDYDWTPLRESGDVRFLQERWSDAARAASAAARRRRGQGFGLDRQRKAARTAFFMAGGKIARGVSRFSRSVSRLAAKPLIPKSFKFENFPF